MMLARTAATAAGRAVRTRTHAVRAAALSSRAAAEYDVVIVGTFSRVQARALRSCVHGCRLRPRLRCKPLADAGGGIIGLATAREVLLRYPSLRLAVLEKEDAIGQHQTGHNSGVVHAGIYYAPGSLKAKLCVRGLDLSYAYFRDRNIPHSKCGKLIVAVSESELPRLDALYERGVANGVKDLTYMSPAEFAKVEPHCSGLRAIYSPHTGIVDWGLVARHYAEDIRALGGHLLLSFEVDSVSRIGCSASSGPMSDEGVQISTCGPPAASIRSSRAIFCAGAFSDRLARVAGGSHVPMIVPVRGQCPAHPVILHVACVLNTACITCLCFCKSALTLRRSSFVHLVR